MHLHHHIFGENIIKGIGWNPDNYSLYYVYEKRDKRYHP